MSKSRGLGNALGLAPDDLPWPAVARDLIEVCAEGVCILDSGRRIRLWNPAAEVITGYAASEVLGARCSEGLLVHVDESGRRLCGGGCPVELTLDSERGGESRAYLRHRRGHRIPVRIRTRLVRGRDDAPFVLEVFSDMSDGPLVEMRLRELAGEATRDPLTGLPNRRALEDALESAAADRRRHGLAFGVVMIDLDGLKAINDTWGHPVGDRALGVLADTLRAAGRATDIWGRWGGDEFLGVVRFAGRDDIEQVGARMVGLACASAVLLDEAEIGIRISAGGTAAVDAEGFMETVSRADRALYESKRRGDGSLRMC